MSATSKKRGVLFVCLGNICRSPIGEAVFQHLIEERYVLTVFVFGSMFSKSATTKQKPH